MVAIMIMMFFFCFSFCAISVMYDKDSVMKIQNSFLNFTCRLNRYRMVEPSGREWWYDRLWELSYLVLVIIVPSYSVQVMTVPSYSPSLFFFIKKQRIIFFSSSSYIFRLSWSTFLNFSNHSQFLSLYLS